MPLWVRSGAYPQRSLSNSTDRAPEGTRPHRSHLSPNGEPGALSSGSTRVDGSRGTQPTTDRSVAEAAHEAASIPQPVGSCCRLTDGTEAHQLFLMCDDVAATVAELTAKGVAFTGPVVDRGWGMLTAIRLPGGGELGLYEPRHPTARDV